MLTSISALQQPTSLWRCWVSGILAQTGCSKGLSKPNGERSARRGAISSRKVRLRSGYPEQFAQLGAAAGGVCGGLAEDEAGESGIGWRFGMAGAVDQANGHIPAIIDRAADGAGQLPNIQ